MASYIQRKRKGELIALCEEAGIHATEDQQKNEIYQNLMRELYANPDAHQHKASFEDFFGQSPYKRAQSEKLRASQDDDDRPAPVENTRTRRKTIKTEALESPLMDKFPEPLTTRSRSKARTLASRTSPEAPIASPTELVTTTSSAVRQIAGTAPRPSSGTTRTPGTIQRDTTRLPLPESPAVVSEYIENKQTAVADSIRQYWRGSGMPGRIEQWRERLSSLHALQTILILFEWSGMRRETIPLQYAFDIPPFPSLGTYSYPISLPNFLMLATSQFWSPTITWATLSAVLPTIVAYFINFTLKRGKDGQGLKMSSRSYKVDPVSFNVAKAFMTWVVFSQDCRCFGLFSNETVTTVDKGLYGGYNSTLLGCAGMVLFSLYEAAVRR